jgi:hypothetical protein
VDLSRRYRRFVGSWMTVHTKTGGSYAGMLREQSRTYLRLEPARQLIRGGRSVLIDGGAMVPADNIDWLQPHPGQPAAFLAPSAPVMVGEREHEGEVA